MEIGDKKIMYKNVEAAFQANKNPELAEKFLLLSGLEAKKLGEPLKPTDPNWKVNQLYVMAAALHSKFTNFALLFQLKRIDGEIVNDNYWFDTFWGVYKGEGLNILGKMLMNIRDNDNDFTRLHVYVSLELTKYVI